VTGEQPTSEELSAVPKIVFPTFSRLLPLVLLVGVIRGHDRVDGLVP
jgi:hypothetical protein